MVHSCQTLHNIIPQNTFGSSTFIHYGPGGDIKTRHEVPFTFLSFQSAPAAAVLPLVSSSLLLLSPFMRTSLPIYLLRICNFLGTIYIRHPSGSFHSQGRRNIAARFVCNPNVKMAKSCAPFYTWRAKHTSCRCIIPGSRNSKGMSIYSILQI